MKNKIITIILFSLTVLFFAACPDSDSDSSPSGSLEVSGPVSGDNTSETKVYSSGDSFDFGNIFDGADTSKTADFTIKNKSDDTVSLTGSTPVIINSDNNVYLIEGDQPDASIAAGEQVGFTLAFQDNSSAGTEEGTLTIASDNEEFGTFSLDITGVIVEPGNIEIWGPTSIVDSTLIQYSSGQTFDFRDDYITEISFEIRNTGGSDLTLTDLPLTVTGSHAEWFLITEQPGTPIEPNVEAVFKMKWYIADGSHYTDTYGDLAINSDDPDMETFTLSLTGSQC